MVISDAELSDCLASFSITNFLFAGLQGDFAYLNILGQFNHIGFKQEAVGELQKQLAEVAVWNKESCERRPIFTTRTTTPETFEATNALEQLKVYRTRSARLAEVCRQLAQKLFSPSFVTLNTADAQLLAAILGRAYYGRDNYIRGFIEFNEHMERPANVEFYTKLLTDSTNEINALHEILTDLENLPNTVTELANGPTLQNLRIRARDLLFNICSQIHDAALLLAPFSGGITFTNLDFDAEASAKWREAGLDPATAGYWRAYGFNSDEASAWIKGGHAEPALANNWRWFGFNYESAKDWIKIKLPPDRARQWSAAGHASEDVEEYLSRGIRSPDQVRD